jgi:hypothetical protein
VEDILFGSFSQHPIDIPPGLSIPLSLISFIDPSFTHDLYSPTPWVASPLICAANIFSVSLTSESETEAEEWSWAGTSRLQEDNHLLFDRALHRDTTPPSILNILTLGVLDSQASADINLVKTDSNMDRRKAVAAKGACFLLNSCKLNFNLILETRERLVYNSDCTYNFEVRLHELTLFLFNCFLMILHLIHIVF